MRYTKVLPMRINRAVVTVGLLFLLTAFGSLAQEAKPEFSIPSGVTFRTADIMSEGVRMSAEVFAPEGSEGKKLPPIIMSHGWGGVAASLRPDAIRFAQAGYLVIAFDYRGWGKSDSRLILSGSKPEKKVGK